jgi:hypothetical protein
LGDDGGGYKELTEVPYIMPNARVLQYLRVIEIRYKTEFDKMFIN